MKKTTKAIVKNLMEKVHGEKEKAKSFFKLGDFIGNGFMIVKKGFDDVIDAYLEDTGFEKEKNDFAPKNIGCGHCSYEVKNVEVKPEVTKIECEHETIYDSTKGEVYINTNYYNYMVSKGLEIKISPEKHLIIGVQEKDIKVIALGIKMNDVAWDNLKTMEQLEKEKTQAKLEREQAKKLNEQQAISTAKNIIKTMPKIIKGDMNIVKTGDKVYQLEVTKKGEYIAVINLATQGMFDGVRGQKLLGATIIEMVEKIKSGDNSLLEEFATEEKQLQEKRNKNAEDRKALEELISEIKEIYPNEGLEITCWGDEDYGYSFDVRYGYEHIRIKNGYSYEDINKTLDGKKEIVKGSKKMVLEFIDNRLQPIIKEMERVNIQKKEIKKMFSVTDKLIVKTICDNGIEYKIISRYGYVERVVRGRKKELRKIHKIEEYILENCVAIAIYHDGDTLTKKELDKKEFTSINELIVTTTEEKVANKCEEKGDGKMNKTALKNKLNKLGDTLVKNTNMCEGDIVDIVYDIFPTAFEINTTNIKRDGIHFFIDEEYTGKKPTKKEMKEKDNEFSRVLEVNGLSVYISVEEKEIKITASIDVEYEDIFGGVCSESVDVLKISTGLEEEKHIKNIIEVEKKAGDNIQAIIVNTDEKNCVCAIVENKYGEIKTEYLYAGAEKGTESDYVAKRLSEHYEVVILDAQGCSLDGFIENKKRDDVLTDMIKYIDFKEWKVEKVIGNLSLQNSFMVVIGNYKLKKVLKTVYLDSDVKNPVEIIKEIAEHYNVEYLDGQEKNQYILRTEYEKRGKLEKIEPKKEKDVVLYRVDTVMLTKAEYETVEQYKVTDEGSTVNYVNDDTLCREIFAEKRNKFIERGNQGEKVTVFMDTETEFQAESINQYEKCQRYSIKITETKILQSPVTTVEKKIENALDMELEEVLELAEELELPVLNDNEEIITEEVSDYKKIKETLKKEIVNRGFEVGCLNIPQKINIKLLDKIVECLGCECSEVLKYNGDIYICEVEHVGNEEDVNIYTIQEYVRQFGMCYLKDCYRNEEITKKEYEKIKKELQ